MNKIENISDFRWALQKLEKFNEFVLSDENLKKHFVLGHYNFLQAYQTLIFFELVSSFRSMQAGSFKEKDPVRPAGVGVRLRQLFSILFSSISLLIVYLKPRENLIYTSDKTTYQKYFCDFRMVNLFSYLISRNIKFFEFFHTVYRVGFIRTALRRSRLAFYLEISDFFYKLASILGLIKGIDLNFGETNFESLRDDKILFKKIISKYAPMVEKSLFKIDFLKFVIRLTHAKRIIAVADTRNYNELVAACMEEGIEVIGFQGGNISKYSIGLVDMTKGNGRLIRADKFVVESGYWRDELVRLGSYYKKEDILIGGNLKEDYKEPLESHRIDDAGVIRILFPYEIAAPKDEIISYIKKLSSIKKVEVIFKFRADRDLVAQANEYGFQTVPENVRLITNLEEIDGFDVVAGTYSTFLYEMIGKKKPVVILKTTLDYGEGLVINELADEIDINNPDFEGALFRAASLPEGVLNLRRDKLYGKRVMLGQFLDEIFGISK